MRAALALGTPVFAGAPVPVDAEPEVRRLCAAGEYRGAATLAIQALGAELFGFLVVLARDRADAHDSFAELSVRVWRGLPGFRWQCSLRTWTYVLARFAYRHQLRQRTAWATRRVDLDEVHDLEEVLAERRGLTEVQREWHSGRAARLRAQLSPNEQALIELRIDRELEWRDIARLLADDDCELNDLTLARQAAALRKRYERVKVRLRKLAARARGAAIIL